MAMIMQLLEYDLYLDETGRFHEGVANSAKEQVENGRQRGASQLAGILVPRNMGGDEAKKIIAEANKQANYSRTNVIHATNIIEKSRFKYLKIAESIIKAVRARQEWQCVRLVNAEKISYFDRATTYPNLVAEITLRTFQQKLKEHPQSRIGIRLIDPSYKPGKDKPPLSSDEYLRRVVEYLGFAQVRYGLTRESRNWRFDGVVTREYRDTPALQICDVLSHASADKFERLRTQRHLATILKGLFGEYDFTLTIRELFDRVDELVKEHSFGVALMILAEALVHAPHTTRWDKEFAANLEMRLDQIIVRLARMDFRGRDPQLALLVGWLDQLIGQQRLLDKGYEIAYWLLDHVETLLRTQLSFPSDRATLDWFAYSLRRWALTACNHKGVLLKGEVEISAMRSLQPSVATQWERIPLVMDGLIAQAVHYTDCFEFDKASERMRFVADSLKLQSNRFHELMPGDFPEKLRFDLRARALGTLVQSEIFAGATDPARLQSARRANEEAIAEFKSYSDRARQYQYRCHLETVARDFAVARKYLVRSLEATGTAPREYSHQRIANLIRELSTDPEWKGEFALLHWLRIGAYACLAAHQGSNGVSEAERLGFVSERDEFLSALEVSEQLNSDVCKGRVSEYPAHSVLRFVAVINAARSNWQDSLLALKRLDLLDPIGKEQAVLAIILLASHAEVAALMWDRQRVEAQRLLQNKIPQLARITQIGEIAALWSKWQASIRHLADSEPGAEEASAVLLKLAGESTY
jgi:hypothetical protein